MCTLPNLFAANMAALGGRRGLERRSLRRRRIEGVDGEAVARRLKAVREVRRCGLMRLRG